MQNKSVKFIRFSTFISVKLLKLQSIPVKLVLVLKSIDVNRFERNESICKLLKVLTSKAVSKLSSINKLSRLGAFKLKDVKDVI